MQKVWYCKIGGELENLPYGADLPMRQAIKEAYFRLTGKHYDFLFSGWGGKLTEMEQQVVNENPSEIRIIK